jgi:UDPglucose 6-dehydrogenase
MSKNIAVIGTGYVGLVAAVGLADFGNRVIGCDIDKGKIETLNKGTPTIYEPGIEEYLKRNVENGRLSFTVDVAEAVRASEVVFLAVGTPQREDGSADLSQIEEAAKTVGQNLDSYKVVITKSTVPVGTNRRIKEIIGKAAAGGAGGPDTQEFDVVSNPEFLREGRAVQDFFHPDRIVIGFETEKAKEMMEDIYRALYLIQSPFVWCGIETAELIKYAANAFLAVKITYINQMANLAEAVGADIHTIAKSMGMDGRISPKFLHPGPGYGGSCFPKDTRAIVSTGAEHGVDMSLIREAIEANERQKERMVDKLRRLVGGSFESKTIGILGLAFKSETEDVRESPAITIVERILKEGATVKAHDPEAMDKFRKLFPDIGYVSTSYDAAKDTDAVVICTEWNEYRTLDMNRIKSVMNGYVVFDTRNVLEPESVFKAGLTYEGVGRNRFNRRGST